MPMLTVADLLNAGRLEHVPADRTAALTRLQIAETHLVTAAALVGVDNDVAYSALYDAAHEAVGVYAKESVPDPTGSMTQFQQMRRRRNKSEYDNLLLGRQDVETDLRHATNIVAAVRADLAP